MPCLLPWLFIPCILWSKDMGACRVQVSFYQSFELFQRLGMGLWFVIDAMKNAMQDATRSPNPRRKYLLSPYGCLSIKYYIEGDNFSGSHPLMLWLYLKVLQDNLFFAQYVYTMTPCFLASQSLNMVHSILLFFSSHHCVLFFFFF